MGLIGSPLTFGKLEQDVLVWMVDNERRYCYTAIKLTNATSADVKHQPGEIIASATLADGADPKSRQGAFTDALLMENVVAPANGHVNARALVRGPAIVNFDALVRSSASESDSALTTRCANLVLNGVQFIREPSVRSTPDLNS